MTLRRRSQTADLARRAAVEPGERVLATAQTSSGGFVVATRDRLIVGDQAAVVAAGEWSDVEHVAHKTKRRLLTIEWNSGPEPVGVELIGRANRLTSVINERVTTSVVASEHVEVDGGVVRVAIRRARDGSLFSQIVVPDGVDLDDSEVAFPVAAARRSLAEATGLV